MSGGPGHLRKIFRNQYFLFLSPHPLQGKKSEPDTVFGASSLSWRVSGGSQSRANHSASLSKADVALVIYTAPAPSEVCADSSGCRRPRRGRQLLVRSELVALFPQRPKGVQACLVRTKPFGFPSS